MYANRVSSGVMHFADIVTIIYLVPEFQEHAHSMAISYVYIFPFN